MSISQFTDDVEVISALSDEPNATDGLTATQLKAKFDEAAGLIKDYLNGTVVPAINSSLPDGQYAEDAGSTDSYAITLVPAPSSYFAGMVVRFKANTANTGAATLNVNGLGAKSIKKKVTSDLNTNDIRANQLSEVIYDGNNFQLFSPSSNTITGDGERIEKGKATVNVSASTSGSTSISFATAFATAPVVVVTLVGDNLYYATAFNVSTSGFTAYATHSNNVGTSATLTVHWVAIGI
ncbi:hypothetical protein [Cohnella sp. GCM10027633]|uniref:hypothetical protein n=1 Tax=unclassified Cohnella TaxID=2636738 RepID=UPI0036361694